MTTFFPTWPVDGPPPIPPVHGLVPAAAAPAAGIRFIVDTAIGPVPENSIAPSSADLEPGLSRRPDGTIVQRQPDGETSIVYAPANAGRERWIGGVAVYPYPDRNEAGQPVEVWDACNPPSALPDAAKTFGHNVSPPEFAATTLVVPITCTAQQVPDQDKFKARAVAVLSAVESWGMERELINGDALSGQPYLADGLGSFPNGDTVTGRQHALQILEQSIAATGRLGVIHCTPMMATALLGNGFALSDKTGVIRTINGFVIIPGLGYAGAAPPNGHATPTSTQEWAYATGPIDIRRSEIFTTPDTIQQALDRSLGATNHRANQVTYRAERYVVISWDTALQAAVLADRCSTDCNVGS